MIGKAMPLLAPVYRPRIPKIRIVRKWHNPFKVRRHTREEHERAVVEHERHLHECGLIAEVRELRGLNLVCWCKPLPCHGDLLRRLANE
jgi:hypothetical protein